MPARTDTPLPPRYGHVRPVAHGGMGEIYQATDGVLGRDVAVKVLAERYARDAQLRERFKREALAAARLSGNENIVTIFDVGEHGDRPFIVMEYLAGGSLDRRLQGGQPCDPGQVLTWLEEAASALDAAHAAGIVHRDVKPGNLLLDERDHVKVADFGIASAAGMDSFTQTGTILGTAGYLSPEQARGERASAASDRYALAVVAWELLTGRRPFRRDSAPAEAAAHVNAPVPSAHEARPDLPSDCDAVFARGLAKDPAARFGSASEFVSELRSAFHSAAGDTGWIEPQVPAATVPTRIATAHRRSAWWFPLLLGAVVAGAAVAFVLTSRDSKHATSPSARTVIRTVTGPGTTVVTTATTAPSPPPPPPSPSPPPPSPQPSGATGSQLNDQGFAKMQQGDYAGALPLLEQAVQKLSGTGAIAEAYAAYNLAYTRRKLGQCTDVLQLLDRSEAVQGHRKEINALRHEARRACS
jgi:eukaryotic-like serine/threonine-protein kinase